MIVDFFSHLRERGRLKYNGLSRLAMGVGRCSDRVNERLRLRSLGTCQFIDDENLLSFLAV